MLSNYQKKILIFFTGLIYISYFLGFYFNENSIGSGGLDGDLSWMWDNFKLFKNNNLIDAIQHEEFFGNRTPLLYIINVLINPFINDIYHYRLSIFLFSLIGPFFFYLCLKNKFKKTEKEILYLISSFLLISPFYRTTAYWGMEINYGIITMLISFYYVGKIDAEVNKNYLKNVLYLVFFSSLAIYFDQKLLFIPILALFRIILIKNNLQIKILSLVLYFILSIPYIYLIYMWEGIVPISTQVSNPNTITNISRFENFYTYHLGYASTIIAFYLFPLLLLKEANISLQINNFFTTKKNYLILLIPVIYILYLYSSFNFKFYTVDEYWIGLGLVHKLSIIFFSNIKNQEIFTYLIFFLSWCVISIYIKKNLHDWLILAFFFILSLFIWPLMQEYFDLIITILALLIFKTKIKLKYTNVLFLFFYLTIFLIGSNIYYLNIK